MKLGNLALQRSLTWSSQIKLRLAFVSDEVPGWLGETSSERTTGLFLDANGDGSHGRCRLPNFLNSLSTQAHRTPHDGVDLLQILNLKEFREHPHPDYGYNYSSYTADQH